MTQPIEELYAWVCDDPETGREVLALTHQENISVALVSTCGKRAQNLRMFAQSVAQARKQEVRLIRCVDPQVVEAVRP